MLQLLRHLIAITTEIVLASIYHLDWVIDWCPACQLSIVLLGTWNFASQLLESLPLGFWNQQRCKYAAQHEECEDLHDVVEPWGVVAVGWCTASVEWADDDLRNDGTDFTGSGAKPVRSRAIPGGEAFAGYNEGCRIRA